MEKQRNEQWVVVTTDKDRKGVFFGNIVSEEEDVVILEDARMAVYWSSDSKGVLGLASIGPQDGSRITPPVPKLKVNGVTSVIYCTDIAIKQWEAAPWN